MKLLSTTLFAIGMTIASVSTWAADEMNKDGMAKDRPASAAMAHDCMKKDGMAKDAMMKDRPASAAMAHDCMKKDSMGKDAMKKDAMGKDDMAKDGDAMKKP
jgi:pentapeptide MXKDX repeat protein